jgi:3-hydroxybutyryl-CoA dehydrogenase
MNMPDKLRIGVIGAGLMGHGIAQVFASHGHYVAVYDPSEASLATLKERIRTNLRDLGQSESAMQNVMPCPNLPDAVREADFIVEAALEDLPLKQRLFAQIEQNAPAHAILASNTSVIPITEIMRGLRDRARAVGTHWWNPPYLVPLVEVIGTEWTAPSRCTRQSARRRFT